MSLKLMEFVSVISKKFSKIESLHIYDYKLKIIKRKKLIFRDLKDIAALIEKRHIKGIAIFQ